MRSILTMQQVFGRYVPRIIDPGSRSHAAVAMVLHEREDGLHLLFMERAINENDYWSGHICFPGGRVEPEDAGPRQAAEREASEELGLDLTSALFMGRLNDYVPGGLPIVVSSFLYAVADIPLLHPDPAEVASTIWFPVRELADPRRGTMVEFLFNNRVRRFPAVYLDQRKNLVLWGITYRLVRAMGKLAVAKQS